MQAAASGSVGGAGLPAACLVLHSLPCLPPARKELFLVRHGESRWNEAKGRLALAPLLLKSDHALSHKGLAQARALRALLADALARAPGGLARGAPLERLARADAVWCSPLTRALQTCLVGLRPLLSARGLPVCLRKNAREPQHLADLNSRGVAIGAAAMLRRAADKLRELGGDAAAGAELAELEGAPVESAEAEAQWWDEGGSETAAQLRGRLRELLRQLQYCPQQTVVLVTHGAVIQQLLAMAGGGDPGLVPPAEGLRSGSPLEAVLGGPPREGKVEGCSVVCCKLDFAGGSRLLTEVCVIAPRLLAEGEGASDSGGRARAHSADSAPTAAPTHPETPGEWQPGVQIRHAQH